METNKPRASFGPLKDLENIKQNGSASLAELKEFLTRLQGRSPQEVVGIVSTSMMVQSMVLATLATLAIMVVFTLGPYMVYGPPKEKTATAAPPAAPASAAANNTETPAAESAKPGEMTEEGKTKAMSKMGIDETKTADPNKNPLDKVDNLLEGLK